MTPPVAQCSETSDACPVCGGNDASDLLTIPRAPVHCNLLYGTRNEARAAPRRDIRLAACPRCQHVFHPDFDPELMAYTGDYENSLHHSAHFQSWADELATRLVTRHDLRNKRIVEIGCGRGDFLALLCRLGGNHGLGFDPSRGTGSTPEAAPGSMEIVPETYGEREGDPRADLYCCRHVLEHLDDPGSLLRMFRNAMADEPGARIFCEVPNAEATLRQGAIWDIIYEHPSYFGVDSLRYAFREAGLEVLDTWTGFGEQFLCIEARARGRDELLGDLEDSTQRDPLELTAFVADYHDKLARWQDELRGIAERGERAVVWGAGSKGTSFLNLMETEEIVTCAVDLNPRKQGHFVAGTGHEIVPPGQLREVRPDVVIVMNREYESEIRRDLNELGLDAQLSLA